MATIQKTITVQVCDRCGAERAYGSAFPTCAECKQDLCSSCARLYFVGVGALIPEKHGKTTWYTQHGTDVFSSGGNNAAQFKAHYCQEHATLIEQRLREAGFRDFTLPKSVPV